jgi:hypothetical protein
VSVGQSITAVGPKYNVVEFPTNGNALNNSENITLNYSRIFVFDAFFNNNRARIIGGIYLMAAKFTG